MANRRAPPTTVTSDAARGQRPLRRDEERVVKFYNGRGVAEQWIKEGKNAVKWTKLSCHDFVDNQVRLQLFALAYNLGNFLRRVALPPGLHVRRKLAGGGIIRDAPGRMVSSPPILLRRTSERAK